jgi:hypothetical protein
MTPAKPPYPPVVEDPEADDDDDSEDDNRGNDEDDDDNEGEEESWQVRNFRSALDFWPATPLHFFGFLAQRDTSAPDFSARRIATGRKSLGVDCRGSCLYF